MDVKPVAAGPAVNEDEPRQADLAQEDPLVQPDNRDRATHSTNAHRSGTPARKASNCSAHAADTQQMRATLGSPTAHDVEHQH